MIHNICMYSIRNTFIHIDEDTSDARSVCSSPGRLESPTLHRSMDHAACPFVTGKKVYWCRRDKYYGQKGKVEDVVANGAHPCGLTVMFRGVLYIVHDVQTLASAPPPRLKKMKAPHKPTKVDSPIDPKFDGADQHTRSSGLGNLHEWAIEDAMAQKEKTELLRKSCGRLLGGAPKQPNANVHPSAACSSRDVVDQRAPKRSAPIDLDASPPQRLERRRIESNPIDIDPTQVLHSPANLPGGGVQDGHDDEASRFTRHHNERI